MKKNTRINQIPKRRILIPGLGLAFFIIILPFTILLHLVFSPVRDSFIVMGFELQHNWESNQTLVWTLIASILPVVFFVLFFFTSRGKWKLPMLLFGMLFFIDFGFNLYLKVNTLIEFIFSIIGSISLIFFLILIFILDIKFFSQTLKNQIILRTNELIAGIWEVKSNESILQNFKEKLESYKRQELSRNDLSGLYFSVEKLKSMIKTRKDSYRLSVYYNKFLWMGLCLLVTFLWFAHSFVNNSTQELDIGFVKISSNGFLDLKTSLWYLTRKLVVLIFLIIWFLTSNKWWRYSILSPIFLYSYQFWESFYPHNRIEELTNLRVLPFTIGTILLIYFASRLIYNKLKTRLLINELEELIDRGIMNEIQRRSITLGKRIKQNKIKQLSELERLKRDVFTELNGFKS